MAPEPARLPVEVNTTRNLRGGLCPEHAFYLSADLDRTVCPFLAFRRRWNFGHLRRETIDAIVRTRRFFAFRDRFAAGRWPAVCEECACRFTEGA